MPQGPLYKTSCFGIAKLWEASLSSILGLLFPCGPPAITRFIVAVIVDAFHGETRRPWPHVIIKLLKGTQPFFANLNASAPIPLIGSVTRINTAILHICPYMVFRFIRKIALFAFGYTPAGLYVSGSQIFASGYNFFTTIAKAFKCYVLPSCYNIRSSFKHKQSSKSLSASIYKVYHKNNITYSPLVCQEAIV